MRIHILTSSLPPRPVGGAERQAHDTAVHLALRGHAVTVFARAVRGDSPGEVEDRGVTWVRLAARGPAGVRFLDHIRRFRASWNSRPRPDVVLAYQVVINGVLASLLPASPPPPFAIWIRSESEVRLDTGRKYRMLTPRVLDKARLILTQSETVGGLLRTQIAALGDERLADRLEGRTRVLANAVALGEEPVYGDRRGLVFVGRLVPVKGLDVLLAAMRALTDPPPLTVLGDGAQRAAWEAAARGLPVSFQGHADPETVREAVSRAALLVSPSFSEGFPNAVVEAMERGTPAVATSVGSLPELITHGVDGCLVPPGDSDALASAIRDLAGDEPRRLAMARAARARARDYAWDPHLDRLEKLLAQAAEAAPEAVG